MATMSEAERERTIRLLEYHLRVKKASLDILELAQLFMPDPEGQRKGNLIASRFDPGDLHRFLAAKLQGAVTKTGRKAGKHIALAVPPQHGKTQLGSIFFIAWLMGKFPHLNILFATYNENYARSIGRKVKAITESKLFAQVFPGFALRKDSKSAEVLSTTKGGGASFLGRGGSGTGKPADILLIDDPIKGRAEAKSELVIAELWDWYTDVADTRCHVGTLQIVIHTRWIVDDLIGRLCDPTHEDYDPKLAKHWDYINIPAINTNRALAEELGQTLEAPTDPDVIEEFGDKPLAALWPERFPAEFLALKKRRSRKTFEALYQGNPSPDDGELFTRDMLVGYGSPEQIPTRGVMYLASDHAIGERRDSDSTCLGCVLVDDNDDWWVLPDLFWQQTNADGIIEAAMAKIAAHRPVMWFGENDMIGKTLGPSIRRRMEEERLYTMMVPVSTTQDKVAKSANLQARMSLRKVRFPKFAPWYARLESQFLKFPVDKHDDAVDFLGIMARGLDSVRGTRRPKDQKSGPEPGTFDALVALGRKARRSPAQGRHYCSL